MLETVGHPGDAFTTNRYADYITWKGSSPARVARLEPGVARLQSLGRSRRVWLFQMKGVQLPVLTCR